MLASILLGAAIFGYAGWTFWRQIRISKEGKCAGCALKDECGAACND